MSETENPSPHCEHGRQLVLQPTQTVCCSPAISSPLPLMLPDSAFRHWSARGIPPHTHPCRPHTPHACSSLMLCSFSPPPSHPWRSHLHREAFLDTTIHRLFLRSQKLSLPHLCFIILCPNRRQAPAGLRPCLIHVCTTGTETNTLMKHSKWFWKELGFWDNNPAKLPPPHWVDSNDKCDMLTLNPSEP